MNALRQNTSKFFDNFKKSARKIKPFSWQTALLLSLLSWVVFLILEDLTARRFVSIYGWFFLIIGVDWYFLDDKEDKKKLYLPGLDLLINWGPWITGALVCWALYSYRFLISDVSTALISWPLVSVAIAALPRILRPGLQLRNLFRVPKDPGVRQDLVLLVLIGSLFSCWFQFHFLLQTILEQYPSIRADNFNQSAFVIQVAPTDATASRGAVLLEAAEERIRDELAGLPWLDVQQRLRNIEAEVPRLESEILNQVYDPISRVEERAFWQLNADFEDALPDDILDLQAIWRGPSSQAGGYTLRKVCAVRRASALSALDPANLTESGVSYEMECQPIRSTLPDPETERTDAEIVE